MKLLFASLAFLLSVAAKECSSKKNIASNTPECVQQKIEEIKKQHVWSPPAEVNEYLFNNKQVFLFSSDCCDNFNELFDENCNRLCAPSGGITGRGDLRCEDFNANAKHVRLVWRDERGK